MFKTQEVANILGVSKSTLFRYLKEQPRGLTPQRKEMGGINARTYDLDDIFALAMTQEKHFPEDQIVDKKALDYRTALYGLALAVTRQNRTSEILETINPILEEHGQLKKIYNTYKKNNLITG